MTVEDLEMSVGYLSREGGETYAVRLWTLRGGYSLTPGIWTLA